MRQPLDVVDLCEVTSKPFQDLLPGYLADATIEILQVSNVLPTPDEKLTRVSAVRAHETDGAR